MRPGAGATSAWRTGSWSNAGTTRRRPPEAEVRALEERARSGDDEALNDLAAVKALAVGAWAKINAAVSWRGDEDAQPLERAGDPQGLEVTVFTGKNRHELQQRHDREVKRCDDCKRTFTSIPHFHKTVCCECRKARNAAKDAAKKQRKRGHAPRRKTCALCRRPLTRKQRFWCAEHAAKARALSVEMREKLKAQSDPP